MWNGFFITNKNSHLQTACYPVFRDRSGAWGFRLLLVLEGHCRRGMLLIRGDAEAVNADRRFFSLHRPRPPKPSTPQRISEAQSIRSRAESRPQTDSFVTTVGAGGKIIFLPNSAPHQCFPHFCGPDLTPTTTNPLRCVSYHARTHRQLPHR